MKTQFENWWEEEGVDLEFEPKELCRIAWANGAFCEREKLEFALEDSKDEELETQNRCFGDHA